MHIPVLGVESLPSTLTLMRSYLANFVPLYAFGPLCALVVSSVGCSGSEGAGIAPAAPMNVSGGTSEGQEPTGEGPVAVSRPAMGSAEASGSTTTMGAEGAMEPAGNESEPPPVALIQPIETPPEPEESCSSASVGSEVEPGRLIILLDSSGSMWADPEDRVRRWDPVTTAIKGFVQDPTSTGLSASLTFFPYPIETSAQCDVDPYAVPNVPLTALPNATEFAPVIDNRLDKGFGSNGTPTWAALSGAITNAQELLAADPETATAIVLLTDGLPLGCGGEPNNTEGLIELLAGAADTVPTFVIGFGQIDNLNSFAQAGGTGDAVVIDLGDPVATQTELTQRLKEIREAVISCEVPIPDPPEGKMFDPAKVTTQFRVADGSVSELPFDADCGSGIGWNYDNLDAPSLIRLCEQSCDLVRQNAQSTLEVVFGCALNPQIVR